MNTTIFIYAQHETSFTFFYSKTKILFFYKRVRIHLTIEDLSPPMPSNQKCVSATLSSRLLVIFTSLHKYLCAFKSAQHL